MMRLAVIPERAAQGAQLKPQHAGPASAACVEALDFSVASHAMGDAKDVGRRDPVAALHGGVANGEKPICSIIVKSITVQDKTSVNLIEYNASTRDGAGRSGQDGHDFTVADGRMHAGPAGTEGDGRALPEQRGDDFRGFRHDGGGFGWKR